MTTSEQIAIEPTAATEEQLEQEGDVAADFLEGLLDIADIDGDLALDVRAGRAYVSVEAEDASALSTLSHPDTVQALQELTRL
ncbi:single-stranded DNA-binding protein, partial [Staphylococcus aureus]